MLGFVGELKICHRKMEKSLVFKVHKEEKVPAEYLHWLFFHNQDSEPIFYITRQEILSRRLGLFLFQIAHSSETAMREKDPTPKKVRSKPKLKKVRYIVNNISTTCTTKMFKTMRLYQNSTELLLAKLPFSRLVREICAMFGPDYRIQKAALEALQQSAEYYLTDLFIDANRCAGHAKRVTVMPNDMKLVLDIRGIRDPGFSY